VIEVGDGEAAIVVFGDALGDALVRPGRVVTRESSQHRGPGHFCSGRRACPVCEPGIGQLTGTGHGHRHSAHRADHPDSTAARPGCQNQDARPGGWIRGGAGRTSSRVPSRRHYWD